MSNLLLIGPSNGANIRPGQFLAPPMGVYRIASYVRLCEHDVMVYDTNIGGVQGLYKLLCENRFDFVGVSILDDTWANDKSIIAMIKAFAQDSIILAGGQGAAYTPNTIFQSPVDIVVRGWGEFAVQKMMDIYDPGEPLEQFSDVSGLYIGSAENQTDPRRPHTETEFREISAAFDFSDVPYEKYWAFMSDHYSDEQLDIMRNSSMVRTIRLMTTSHCNAGCSFCSSTRFLEDAAGQEQKVLRLPAGDILSLMKVAIRAHPQTEAFYFNDDNFMTSKQRIYDLIDLIDQEFRYRKLRLFALSRVDTVDPDILKRMKAVGFDLMIYGVESFSDNVLKDMRKKTSERRCRQAIEWTLDAGIIPFINLILFYPTTTLEDILNTIDTTVEYMRRGARVAVNTYVVPLSGAAIPATYERNDQKVFPLDSRVRDLAERAIGIKPEVMSEIDNNRSNRLVHIDRTLPIDALSLFIAIYRILGKPTDRIERLVEELCARQRLVS